MNARKLIRIIALLPLLGSSPVWAQDGELAWSSLTPDQQEVLQPVAAEWGDLSAERR